NADVRGRRGLQSPAQRRAMQRRDERNVAARHHLEIAIAIELERQPLRASCLPALRRPAQVKPSAEIIAMTKDDAALCFLASAIDVCAQLLHHGHVKAIALVRAV